MKLYQTTAQTGADSFKVSWNGSGADASKQRSAFKKEGLKSVSTEEIDVPTNKTDLLAWLNTNQVVTP
jgi:hypothetical protein